MVFCNQIKKYNLLNTDKCHNPYFNRWFSAMQNIKLLCILDIGHNPYFNRWFSAIGVNHVLIKIFKRSQSLF